MTDIDEVLHALEIDNQTAVIDDYLNYTPLVDNNDVEFLNILSMNIRSINANFNQFVCCLNGLKTDIHIIILTETWLSVDMPFIFNIPGYAVINKYSKQNKCDGLCMYIKENLNFNEVSLNISEANVLSADLKINNKMLKVIGVYRSPSNRNIDTFLSGLSDTINNIPYDISVCVAGDMNINTHSTSVPVQEYLHVFHSNGYRSFINGDTRVAGTSQSCLDHIFFKNVDNYFDYSMGSIFKTTITDHYSVVLHLGKVSNSNKSDGKKIDTIININYNALLNNLRLENWNWLYTLNDGVDIIMEKFIDRLTGLIDLHKNEKKIPHNRRPLKPWITEGIIRSISTRDKMHARLRRDPTNNDLKNNYKAYRNRLNKIINNTKEAFYKAKIENCNSSIKLWKCINEVVGEIRKENRKPALDASILNDYFTNVGKLQAQTIESCNGLDSFLLDCENTQNRIASTFFMGPTSENEVEATIKNLKTNCSPGIDDISNSLLKKIARYISHPLSFIFNKCFEEGYFPKHFKSAKIKPLFKQGDPSNPSNYRPISLISNLAKIMEKIIKIRIVTFIDKYNIINKNQFGFQNCKSTEDALIKFTNTISQNLNSNMKTLAVFLDIRKAFDTIPHNTLFMKLESYGFRGIFLDLIKSYLLNRTQSLTINGHTSTTNLTTYGLPQGTVLSPILFILYVNDLLSLKLRNSTMISFADDTAAIFYGNSWDEVYSTAEENILNIKKWLDKNTLSLNIDKTNYITFSINRLGQPANNNKLRLHSGCNYNLNNCDCPTINKVSCIKYLGITIDEYLKWDVHIKSICRKMRYLSFKFFQVNKILNKQHLKMLYYALVQSILQYGITVWGGCYNNHLNELFVAQKLILKIILSKPRLYSTNLIFENLKVMTVRQLYIKNVISFIVKYKSQFPITLNSLVNNYSLRTTANKYVTYYTNIECIRRQLIYISTKIINLIPENFLGNSKINNHTKKEIKSWICRNYFFRLDM
jgi:hypothetical protein